jgi:glycosyltransferase involved in cell wall biosynthesis
VVSYLTEELVRMGHEVTLFASGDSITEASLVGVCERSLRLDEACVDPHSHHVRMVELVARQATEYDILHFHIDYLHFPTTTRLQVPRLTTLHGRLDIPDLVPLYCEFPEQPVVSISNAQRQPLPFANWQATIYHGLPMDLYSLECQPQNYLAFVGRISPEKGVDRAIEIARRASIPLKIAAKVDRVDRDYFTQVIKPLLSDPLVEFIGEIGEKEKRTFLGNARAFIFPVNWPEPFGLSMIEAMACGTPVVAFRCGSIPEVVDEGVTGYIVETVDEAVDAVARIGALDRRRCRHVYEERFSVSRMARDYLKVYEALIRGQKPPNP